MRLHDLTALKARFLIPDAWRHLQLPGSPGYSCRSPFREDRSPSFSVFDGGRRWYDFGTCEGGDVIAFIARACDLEQAEATRYFLRIVESGETPRTLPRPISASPKALNGERLRRNLQRAGLHRGSQREVDALARLRRLACAAIRAAEELGVLKFGSVCGFPCWILMDSSGKIAEARRLDGKTFPPADSLPERKAHTLGGSSKSWPIGAAVLRERPTVRAVLLVEGGPDLLAALHFAHNMGADDLLPIAMLGRAAGSQIAQEALDLLAGRRARIYPHVDGDGGGMIAAERWAAQLANVGCHVEIFRLDGLIRRDGKAVNDLNDTALIHRDAVRELSHLLP